MLGIFNKYSQGYLGQGLPKVLHKAYLAIYKSYQNPLQQKVSLYVKRFHWILNEFTSCSEWGPMKK
jgi:hypothetical protein